MNYFDFVSRGTSWEVLEIPPAIEVTERELTDEELSQWIRKLNDLYAARSADSSQA